MKKNFTLLTNSKKEKIIQQEKINTKRSRSLGIFHISTEQSSNKRSRFTKQISSWNKQKINKYTEFNHIAKQNIRISISSREKSRFFLGYCGFTWMSSMRKCTSLAQSSAERCLTAWWRSSVRGLSSPPMENLVLRISSTCSLGVAIAVHEFPNSRSIVSEREEPEKNRVSKINISTTPSELMYIRMSLDEFLGQRKLFYNDIYIGCFYSAYFLIYYLECVWSKNFSFFFCFHIINRF